MPDYCPYCAEVYPGGQGKCALYAGPPDPSMCWASTRTPTMACNRYVSEDAPLGLCPDHYREIVGTHSPGLSDSVLVSV